MKIEELEPGHIIKFFAPYGFVIIFTNVRRQDGVHKSMIGRYILCHPKWVAPSIQCVESVASS